MPVLYFLIEKLESAPDKNKISITHQEILNLRQNLVEVLFAIRIEDFTSQFNLSREGVHALFGVIDHYGEQHGAWD